MMKRSVVAILLLSLSIASCKSSDKKDEAESVWQPPNYFVRLDIEALENALRLGQPIGEDSDLAGIWIEVYTSTIVSETYNWAGQDVIRRREEASGIRTWKIRPQSNGFGVGYCDMGESSLNVPLIRVVEGRVTIEGANVGSYSPYLEILSPYSANVTENKVMTFSPAEFEEEWQDQDFPEVHGVHRGVIHSRWYKITSYVTDEGIGIVTVDGTDAEANVKCMDASGSVAYRIGTTEDPGVSSNFSIMTNSGWHEFYDQMNLVVQSDFWFLHESPKVFVIHTELMDADFIPRTYRISLY